MSTLGSNPIAVRNFEPGYADRYYGIDQKAEAYRTQQKERNRRCHERKAAEIDAERAKQGLPLIYCTSMATYTLHNSRYNSRAYMLLCDDTDRDYGDPEKAASFQKECEENGFYTVSMKEEFEDLYGDGVEKADTILEELEPAA